MKKLIIKIFNWKKIFTVAAAWVKIKKWWIIILVIAGIFISWKFGISAGIFLSLFLSFLIFEWDSWIIGFLALIFLISCPILLTLKKEILAEQMAIYAYYFLVMTVVLQIIEYASHRKNFVDNEKE
ncbi:MAG TPA: hypothetical protein VMC41_03250 [Candidatus Nanoarchaeia archaeon]|nr:hypothetical protein [Candidatus Nanoarchaeia archaeon]